MSAVTNASFQAGVEDDVALVNGYCTNFPPPPLDPFTLCPHDCDTGQAVISATVVKTGWRLAASHHDVRHGVVHAAVHAVPLPAVACPGVGPAPRCPVQYVRTRPCRLLANVLVECEVLVGTARLALGRDGSVFAVAAQRGGSAWFRLPVCTCRSRRAGV